MNIGIITTWFERGAAYVSKLYYEALSGENNVFIFARGGEKSEKGNPQWDKEYVTWGQRLYECNINPREFFSWIKKNKLEMLIFNEQQDFYILALTKKKFPNIKMGAYIDYYKENTIPLFDIYDFVVCNTKRHYSAFEHHKQSIYVKWGTDLEVFKPNQRENEQISFFHSVGMSPRKGTDILLDAFINGKLYQKSKLIIHTQVPIDKVTKYSEEDLKQYPNILIINKTVPAPGLYYMGDVYVYPTRLDGLGLTMYEALASGMPVITSDFPPMNEVVDNSVGRLIPITKHYCRADAYYWPMVVCDEKGLITAMQEYIDSPQLTINQKKNARKKAEEEFDWNKNSLVLKEAIRQIKAYPLNEKAYDLIIKENKHLVRNLVFYNGALYSIYKKIKKIV